MKFNRKLSEQFWRIWCFPIQSDRSCTWMPERRFKDGRRVTWLALKRLWRYYQVSTAVSTDNLWPNHLRQMLLPGVNVALQTRDSCCIHTLPQHINMIRQMKGTHLSWRGRQQAENERNEAKASRRLREIGKRDKSARVTDETDVHKPEKTSDQAHFKAVLSLFTWRSRFLDAKDQLILWFVSYILSGKEERHQPKRKKKC